MIRLAFLALLFLLAGPAAAQPAPVLVGLDAEFALLNSTSAQAIERGATVAITEINRAGGVLGGRPLKLVVTDNRSVPARARDNMIALAAMPDLVAVLCGRFSPVVLDSLDVIHEHQIILLDPWASADGVTDNNRRPSYVFRLSLRDKIAMPVMMRHAQAKGGDRIGLLLPNTGWGRSNAAAAEAAAKAIGARIVATEWYNWGDRSLMDKYQAIRAAGARSLILVANDLEGSVLVEEVWSLPPKERLPIISHWGVTGGRFVEQLGDKLFDLDFSVVQSFSFLRVPPDRLARFMATWNELYGPTAPEAIVSAVGVGQAYDLVRLLARAVDLAGSTDRAAVRDALERVRDLKGLARDFPAPFTAERHDALTEDDVFMAVYRRDGTVVPIAASPP